MRARDILDTTHQLEEKGVNRLQAEAIADSLAAAVEPLATRKELAAAVEPLATKMDLKAVEERLGAEIKTLREKDLKAVKERLGREIKTLREKDLKAMEERLGTEIKTLREKDLKAVEERLGTDMVILFEKTNRRIESTKVWLLGGLLAMALSITFYALQVGAASGGEHNLETGQPTRQPSEAMQSAISDQTNL